MIQKRMINPFIFGRIVTGNDFCPRPCEERALRSAIASSHNTLLLGPRRTGKSSLIHQSCSKKNSPTLIYAQLWAVKSTEDLVSRIVRAMASSSSGAPWLQRVGGLLSGLRPKIEFDPATGAPTLSIGHGAVISPREVHGVFDALEAISANRRYVVALDEFQDVALLPESDALIGEIRDRVQRQHRVTYIFAGSVRHRLEELFTSPQSPFFKAVEVIELGGLENGLFVDYLRKRFQQGGRKADGPFLEAVLDASDRIPSDAQHLCSSIWELTSPGDKLIAEHLHLGLERLLSGRQGAYETIIHPLTDVQMRVLGTVARQGGRETQAKAFLEQAGVRLPASVQRALQRLESLEILYRDRGIWRFFDPFFRAWLVRR